MEAGAASFVNDRDYVWCRRDMEWMNTGQGEGAGNGAGVRKWV